MFNIITSYNLYFRTGKPKEGSNSIIVFKGFYHAYCRVSKKHMYLYSRDAQLYQDLFRDRDKYNVEIYLF